MKNSITNTEKNNLYKEIYNIVYFKNDDKYYNGFAIDDIKKWGKPKKHDDSQYAKVYRDLQMIRKNLKKAKKSFQHLHKEYVNYKNLWDILISEDYNPDNYEFSDSRLEYMGI